MTINSIIKRLSANDNTLTSLHYDDYLDPENDYQPLNSEDLASLTTAMIENHSIVHAEIAFNDFSKINAACFANLLEKNHRITSLFLNCENEIGLEAGTIFVEALEKNHSLTMLNFEGADMTSLDIKERIAKHLALNRTMAKELRDAAKEGNFKLVQQLVQAGASLNDKGDQGNTALHLSGFKRHVEISEYLLNQENQVFLKNAVSQLPHLYMLKEDQLPKKCADLTFFKPSQNNQSSDYLDDYDKLQKYLADRRANSSMGTKPKF